VLSEWSQQISILGREGGKEPSLSRSGGKMVRPRMSSSRAQTRVKVERDQRRSLSWSNGGLSLAFYTNVRRTNRKKGLGGPRMWLEGCGL